MPRKKMPEKKKPVVAKKTRPARKKTVPLPKTKRPTNSRRGLAILYALGLLLAVSAALPAYMQSSFLASFVSLEIVSLFFVAANLITVFCIAFFPRTIKNLGNFLSSKLTLAGYALSLFLLMRADTATTALLGLIMFTVFSNLMWINMDLLVESFSKDSKTGRIRTTYFTFINAGWILAPALSSYLISLSGYPVAFFAAACLVIPAFLLFLSKKKELNGVICYGQDDPIIIIKDIWKNRNLRGIFSIAFLLQVFYSTAVVYIPIYLNQVIGLSWKELGLAFSIMLLPFVIFEIPAGILADKRYGEKEILFVGFSIIIISLLMFFLLKSTSIWIWIIILFFSRVGAALIEAMRETYFFKLVDVEDVGHINIFRTAAPLGYIAGPIIALPIISCLPMNYLFLVIAIVSLSGLAFTASLKDTK
jgi:hypothetical protein